MLIKQIKAILKYLFLILLFGISQTIVAQEKTKITIQFKENTIKEVLLKIEEKTNFYFYFNEGWFDDTTITKSYVEVEIETLLKAIFKDKLLNYYILDKKIILTKNNFIRDDLPDNFFDIESNKNETILSPILTKEFVNSQNIKDSNLIRIGKEDSNLSSSNKIISGYISKSETNTHLEGVKVYIKDTNIKTKTNKKGFYKLHVPKGIYTIVTEKFGLQNNRKRIIIYGNGTLNFNVQEKAIALDEVSISSTKNDNIKKAAIGVTRINIKEIKIVPAIFGERDILKIATTMPGIKTAGEASMGFNVRGGKSDQNLIKLDNAVIYNPSHFFGVFSAINPYSTGKVSIFKGSVPAEFGGRLSSVIDISTKELNTKKFSGQGNVGPITANLVLEVPLKKDKTTILAGFRTTYSDWILKRIDNESVKNSQASFFDGILRFYSKINKKNTLKATVYYSKDKFSISSDSIYKYTNQLASIAWYHKINKKNKLELQLTNSTYEFNIVNDGNLYKNFDLNFSINESQLKLKIDYLLNKKHKFNYGISSKLYHIKPGEIIPLGNESIIESKLIDREKALESAVFIEDRIKINEKLQLNVGFRYSYYAFLGKITQNKYQEGLPFGDENIIETVAYKNNEVVKTYGSPEVRASASYSFTPSFSVKGGYNNSTQFIHRLSSNTTASPIDTWKLSNLNIKPQKSYQFSLGIFKNLKEDAYELSLEGYYKKMKNIIDFKTGATLILNDNIEVEILNGEGKAYGLEFLLRKTIGKLNGWIGYSYSKSLLKLDSEFLTNRVNDGNYFPSNYDKPHDLSMVANYKLTKRYSFSFNFFYQTGRPVTYPIGKFEFGGIQHVLYSDRNKFRIPDYYRFDIGINIEGNHKIKKLAHSFWNISVYNVLGRNNPYSVFFVNNKGEIKAYQTSIFSVPIPTITYNFKF